MVLVQHNHLIYWTIGQIQNGHKMEEQHGLNNSAADLFCVWITLLCGGILLPILQPSPLGIKNIYIFLLHKYLLYIDMFGMHLIYLIFLRDFFFYTECKAAQTLERDCGVKYSFNNVTFDHIWHRNCSLQNRRPGRVHYNTTTLF